MGMEVGASVLAGEARTMEGVGAKVEPFRDLWGGGHLVRRGSVGAADSLMTTKIVVLCCQIASESENCGRVCL